MSTDPFPRKSKRRSGWALAGPYVIGALLGGCVVGALLWGEHRESASSGGPDAARTPPESYSWTEPPAPRFPLPPYARWLEGVIIVLDPGHVGQRDPGGTWRRGPTGLREAEINLRVAQFLREFLQAAGADVLLTRVEDVSRDLSDDEDHRARIALANDAGADLFLSIHHNGSRAPEANYTTVFYHGRPNENRASLDAARHLLSGLGDALRLERHLECALLSDYAVYAEEGFAVLREAEVPAVLTEASFHSNPEEERRLRDPVYNRREAYGLFLGLARWAQAGLPRVAIQDVKRDGRGRITELVVGLDDGLSGRGGWAAEHEKILTGSMQVELNGQAAGFQPEWRALRLRVPVPRAMQAGTLELFVDFENVFGQHVLHPYLRLVTK